MPTQAALPPCSGSGLTWPFWNLALLALLKSFLGVVSVCTAIDSRYTHSSLSWAQERASSHPPPLGPASREWHLLWMTRKKTEHSVVLYQGTLLWLTPLLCWVLVLHTLKTAHASFAGLTTFVMHALFLKLFFDVSLSSPKVKDHACHLHYLPCTGHSAQTRRYAQWLLKVWKWHLCQERLRAACPTLLLRHQHSAVQ